jgi:hypothetical protein
MPGTTNAAGISPPKKMDFQGTGGGETVFCNPPYARRTKDNPGQEDWIRKCCLESQKNSSTTVLLIPARTDNKAQHTYVFPCARYLCFIKGRLKFGDGRNYAPFPSELVVFTPNDYDAQLASLADLGWWIKLQ